MKGKEGDASERTFKPKNVDADPHGNAFKKIKQDFHICQTVHRLNFLLVKSLACILVVNCDFDFLKLNICFNITECKRYLSQFLFQLDESKGRSQQLAMVME